MIGNRIEETIQMNAIGKITTIADGFDVKKVNLFTSTTQNRTIRCSLKNNEKVTVIEDADPYYLVEKISDKDCRGYCLKTFVIIEK